MLVVEVMGSSARSDIVRDLRRLATSCPARVEVVTAETPTHVAGLVIAADTVGAVERWGVDADVVLGPLPGEINAVWQSRLEPFARRLAGASTPSSPAELVESDPSWALSAHRKLTRLRRALAGLEGADTFSYEHIGSTSVPGMMAKPIIDLQICVPTLPARETVWRHLLPAGYLPATGARPDSPGVFEDAQRGRHVVEPALLRKQLYVCPDPGAPSILHIRQHGSPFARHTALLRDWLRNNPTDRAAYQRLKVELADQHANDLDYDDYTRGKSAFIADLANKIDDIQGDRRAGRTQQRTPPDGSGCADTP